MGGGIGSSQRFGTLCREIGLISAILSSMQRIRWRQEYLVVLFFVVAVVVRFFPIPTDLFFGPEQGKDAFAVRQIYDDKKFPLIGAKTDVDGIFHGPLFYYFLALPYGLSGGNPVAASFTTIVVNCLSIFLFYCLGKTLFSQRIGLLAAFFFTLSLRMIEYARWLSAQPLSPLLVLVLMYTLYQLARAKRGYLYLSLFVSGLLIQLQLLHAYFLPPMLVIYAYVAKIKFRLKESIIGVCIFAITLSTFFAFEIRHNFLMSKNVAAVFRGEKGFHAPLSSSIRETSERFGKEVMLMLTPNHSIISWTLVGVGFLLCLGALRRKSFSGYHLVVLFLLVPVIVLATSRHSVLSHYFIFVAPTIFFLAALVIDFLWKYSRGVALAVVVFFAFTNLSALRLLLPWGITIATEKYIIDFIYHDAGGRQFRYEAYTFPYFWKDAWDYMFLWYGQPRYGYVPKDQGVELVYFIWEEEDTNYQRFWFADHVSQYGNIVTQTKHDNVHVERREKPKK
ncbi:glycosyltransferase family 39 protein [Candidatus Gottesmanbacteria bacterium]|nr:glycosyltransferase family 39 protein [Candidatus Gottesmanbacteria bacterium]